MKATPIYLFIGGVLASGPGEARPTSLSPLSQLTSQADVVVVARTVTGGVASMQLTATLNVQRVIKGALQPDGTIAVSAVMDYLDFVDPSLTPNQTGLWFLRRKESGGYTALPVLLPPGAPQDFLIPAAPNPIGALRVLPTDESEAAVVLEIASAVGSGHVRPTTAISLVQSSGSLSAGMLDRLMTSSSSNMRAFALARFTAARDYSKLTELETILGNLDPASAASTLDAATKQLDTAEPRIVALVGRIVSRTGSPRQLRYSAARVLGGMHTKETLPFLAPLLDDPDADIRATAVAGFSSFVANLPLWSEWNQRTLYGYVPQPPAPYLDEATRPFLIIRARLPTSKEASILSFWRAWWTANSTALRR